MPANQEAHNEDLPISSNDVVTTGSDPRQLALFNQVLQIERERIKSQDRRTEVALRVVELSDASDVRQYEYHMERLRVDEKLAAAHLSLGSRIALGMGAVLTLVLLSVLYMIFFGSETQASRAKELAVWFFAALGGGGLFVAAQTGMRWLMRRG